MGATLSVYEPFLLTANIRPVKSRDVGGSVTGERSQWRTEHGSMCFLEGSVMLLLSRHVEVRMVMADVKVPKRVRDRIKPKIAIIEKSVVGGSSSEWEMEKSWSRFNLPGWGKRMRLI